MWFSLGWYLEHWDSFQLLSEIWIWGSLRWLGRSCHLELSHCHVTWYRAPSFCALPKNCHTTTTGIQIHNCKETNTQIHPCHQIPCTFLALILKTTTQQKAQSQAQYKMLGRQLTSQNCARNIRDTGSSRKVNNHALYFTSKFWNKGKIFSKSPKYNNTNHSIFLLRRAQK